MWIAHRIYVGHVIVLTALGIHSVHSFCDATKEHVVTTAWLPLPLDSDCNDLSADGGSALCTSSLCEHRCVELFDHGAPHIGHDYVRDVKVHRCFQQNNTYQLSICCRQSTKHEMCSDPDGKYGITPKLIFENITECAKIPESKESLGAFQYEYHKVCQKQYGLQRMPDKGWVLATHVLTCEQLHTSDSGQQPAQLAAKILVCCKEPAEFMCWDTDVAATTDWVVMPKSVTSCPLYEANAFDCGAACHAACWTALGHEFPPSGSSAGNPVTWKQYADCMVTESGRVKVKIHLCCQEEHAFISKMLCNVDYFPIQSSWIPVTDKKCYDLADDQHFYCMECEKVCRKAKGIERLSEEGNFLNRNFKKEVAKCEEREDKHGNKRTWVIMNFCCPKQAVCETGEMIEYLGNEMEVPNHRYINGSDHFEYTSCDGVYLDDDLKCGDDCSCPARMEKTREERIKCGWNSPYYVQLQVQTCCKERLKCSSPDKRGQVTKHLDGVRSCDQVDSAGLVDLCGQACVDKCASLLEEQAMPLHSLDASSVQLKQCGEEAGNITVTFDVCCKYNTAICPPNTIHTVSTPTWYDRYDRCDEYPGKLAYLKNFCGLACRRACRVAYRDLTHLPPADAVERVAMRATHPAQVAGADGKTVIGGCLEQYDVCCKAGIRVCPGGTAISTPWIQTETVCNWRHSDKLVEYCVAAGCDALCAEYTTKLGDCYNTAGGGSTFQLDLCCTKFHTSPATSNEPQVVTDVSKTTAQPYTSSAAYISLYSIWSIGQSVYLIWDISSIMK